MFCPSIRLLGRVTGPLRCMSGAADGRLRVLTAALKHVPVSGWSDETLARGAVDAGLPAHSFKVVERGPVELVEFFLAQKRGHVNTELQTVPSEEDVGEIQLGRLRRLVELHMEYVSSSGLLPTWPSALALLSDPRHAQTSVAAAVDLSGDLCRAAGLSPSRLDWYSERLLLVSLYSGAELFLLTDASENIEDTKDFIHRSTESYQTFRRDPSLASGVHACTQTLLAFLNR